MKDLLSALPGMIVFSVGALLVDVVRALFDEDKVSMLKKK
jgi:hypothetical protein